MEGNEKVDSEAKEAAKGHTSTACNLPSFLTDEALPLSSSSTKLNKPLTHCCMACGEVSGPCPPGSPSCLT